MSSNAQPSASECTGKVDYSIETTRPERGGGRPGNHPAVLACQTPLDSTLVLGLGNDILTDDAIGLRVVRELEHEFKGDAQVHLAETCEMGLALLDFIFGYSRVFLVDSIQTRRAPAGFVHQIDARALPRLTERTPHFLGVGETLALGRQLGLTLPELLLVFAVEVQDPYTLSERMTPVLEAALPAIVERIAVALRQVSK